MDRSHLTKLARNQHVHSSISASIFKSQLHQLALWAPVSARPDTSYYCCFSFYPSESSTFVSSLSLTKFILPQQQQESRIINSSGYLCNLEVILMLVRPIVSIIISSFFIAVIISRILKPGPNHQMLSQAKFSRKQMDLQGSLVNLVYSTDQIGRCILFVSYFHSRISILYNYIIR